MSKKASQKVRTQIPLTLSQVAILDQLRGVTNSASKGEVLKKALSLFVYAVEKGQLNLPIEMDADTVRAMCGMWYVDEISATIREREGKNDGR